MGIYRPNEVLTGDIDFYYAYTLVDITDTANTNPKGNTNSYRQAQNLNSLIQALSLRSQLVLSSVSELKNQDLSDYDFGNSFSGVHTVWVFKFASEKANIWAKEDNPVFFAEQDTNIVPIHLGLDETALISDYFNSLNSETKNIYFTFSESL